MTTNDDIGHEFSALSKVKLSDADKNDILQNLRNEMGAYKPRRKRSMGVLPGFAAAAAAVAVVGGFGVAMNKHHPVSVPTSHPTTASHPKPIQGVPSNIIQPPQTPLQNAIQVQSYSTAQAAAAVIIGLQQTIGQVYPSGPAVDLGTGIKANFNGGAGTYVYQWHEGNWTLNVLGTGNRSSGTQVAKNVVSYLHTHMLPAPNNNGTIIIKATTNSWTTTIAWQEGNKVYQLKQNGNPVSALTTVVNQNPTGNPNGQQPTFLQTFKSSGASSQVFLGGGLGFQVTNLGGGMNNFMYQFSKTTDGGKTWTKMSTGHYSHIEGISFIDDKTGYLLNNSPAYAVTPDLFVTHDGGATWNEQKLSIPSVYKNSYRNSNYPIFLTPSVGFIPIYGQATPQSTTTQFLYMLVTTDGGTSWTAYTTSQGGGLSWNLNGQKLQVLYGSQTITVDGLLVGAWTVSP